MGAFGEVGDAGFGGELAGRDFHGFDVFCFNVVFGLDAGFGVEVGGPVGAVEGEVVGSGDERV